MPADANLRALCQWCHLHHDAGLHIEHARATRQTRKDAARPLLRETTAEAGETRASVDDRERDAGASNPNPVPVVSA